MVALVALIVAAAHNARNNKASDKTIVSEAVHVAERYRLAGRLLGFASHPRRHKETGLTIPSKIS